MSHQHDAPKPLTSVTERHTAAQALLAAFAALCVSTVSLPVTAANLTWQAGTDGAWIDGGGNWVSGGPWSNANPDSFTHNSTTRSLVALDGALVATYLRNMNGGILLMDGDSLNVTGNTENYIGRSGGAAAFYQDGGAISISGDNGHLQIGSAGNSYGFYQMTGGSLAFTNNGALRLARTPFGNSNDVGVLYQSGGAVTTNFGMELAVQGSNNHAVYYMTGGTYTSTGRIAGAIASGAAGSTAQVTISNATMGSTSTLGNTATFDLANGTTANQTSILNLNTGGILQTTRIRAETGPADPTTVRHVNFNGGTMRDIRPAGGDGGAPLLGGASQGQYYSIYVFAGGATLDIVNAGYTANVTNPINAPTGLGVSNTTVTLAGADRGTGYVGAPVVLISGATGATAVANMEDDGSGNGTYRVASITITNPGINAAATPTFSFVGGGATTAATGGNLSTAANVSGGLTKIGLGNLNLSAVNTYTGETRVQQGALWLQSTGDLSLSSGVQVSAGATFNASNKVGAVIQRLSGAGTVVARNDATLANRLLVTERLAPGDSVGTLTITDGDLRVGDGVVYEYEIGGTTEATVSDLINITRPFNEGDLTFDGDWTLKLVNLGTVDPTGKTFVLFDYTGLVAGIGSWDSYTIDYGTTNWAGGTILHDTVTKQILLTDLAVIPEPASLALIVMGLTLVIRRRK